MTDIPKGHTVTHDRVQREIALILVHGHGQLDHSACSDCHASPQITSSSRLDSMMPRGSRVYTCRVIIDCLALRTEALQMRRVNNLAGLV